MFNPSWMRCEELFVKKCFFINNKYNKNDNENTAAIALFQKSRCGWIESKEKVSISQTR